MATSYDNAFFSFITNDSLPSARLLVPLVMEMLHPQSVVDVGCGPGAWLRAFAENGVRSIRGFDGDYIDSSALLIDKKHFISTDLTQPITLDCRYDLAVCIEVAEHLSSKHADGLIGQLTTAAPAVLFSAAIPGQGGTNHLNEQWLGYWRDLFAKRGFTMIDAFRPTIRDDRRIAFYIRQNLVLFLNDSVWRSHPAFQTCACDGTAPCTEWVHVEVYKTWLVRATTEPGVRELLGSLPCAILRSIGRKLRIARARGKLIAKPSK